jgi:hypothetical protein
MAAEAVKAPLAGLDATLAGKPISHTYQLTVYLEGECLHMFGECLQMVQPWQGRTKWRNTVWRNYMCHRITL